MSILEFKVEDLPSRGITYPEGTIIQLEKFTFGEVQDLNTLSLSIETKIEKFCKALKINTELSADNIAYIDYIYMHLSRVANVYNSNKIKFPVTCPHCEKMSTQVVDLSELEVNDISEYTDIMPFTVTLEGHEYVFNYLTIGKIIKWFRLINNIQQYETFTGMTEEYNKMKLEVDKITIENPNQVLQAKWETLHKQYTNLKGKMTSKNQARAVKYKDYGLNSLLLAFMCSDFGSEEFDNFLNCVIKLQGEDLETLDFIESTLEVSLKPYKITCEHCAKIYTVSLEESVNDVYPFRRNSADIANKLRASKKVQNTSKTTEE